jgi:DNA-binding NtrC family response regulator
MTSPETVSFSEMALLQLLTAHSRRPNLLIVNKGAALESVLDRLNSVCRPPFRVCRLPGRLELPQVSEGTLVLGNIEQLTIGQQIALLDWLSRDGKSVQIVSVTGAPLSDMIAEGRFLEGLFYRINTVVVLAHKGRSPAVSW